MNCDQNYDWFAIETFDGHVEWVRGACRHLDVVPVESGGEVVAGLCLVCGAQLPADLAPKAQA